MRDDKVGGERESMREKSERPQRPEIAVSVLVFISASVAGDAKSVSFVPRSIEQTAKEKTKRRKDP